MSGLTRDIFAMEMTESIRAKKLGYECYCPFEITGVCHYQYHNQKRYIHIACKCDSLGECHIQKHIRMFFDEYSIKMKTEGNSTKLFVIIPFKDFGVDIGKSASGALYIKKYKPSQFQDRGFELVIPFLIKRFDPDEFSDRKLNWVYCDDSAEINKAFGIYRTELLNKDIRFFPRPKKYELIFIDDKKLPITIFTKQKLVPYKILDLGVYDGFVLRKGVCVVISDYTKGVDENNNPLRNYIITNIEHRLDDNDTYVKVDYTEDGGIEANFFSEYDLVVDPPKDIESILEIISELNKTVKRQWTTCEQYF